MAAQVLRDVIHAADEEPDHGLPEKFRWVGDQLCDEIDDMYEAYRASGKDVKAEAEVTNQSEALEEA